MNIQMFIANLGNKTCMIDLSISFPISVINNVGTVVKKSYYTKVISNHLISCNFFFANQAITL